jgi:hypothetical protein
MRTRKRMHPYVTRDLDRRVTSHCAAKGITVSAFVEAALEARLDGEAKDNEVILRDLARLGRGSMGLQRGLAVLTESFSVFAGMWFGLLPPIADADRPAAEHLAARRFEHFVSRVAHQLATGPGLVAEVAKTSQASTAPGGGVPTATAASGGNRTPSR